MGARRPAPTAAARARRKPRAATLRSKSDIEDPSLCPGFHRSGQARPQYDSHAAAAAFSRVQRNAVPRLSRIGQHSVRLRYGALRQARWRNSFQPKNMKHPLAGDEQVVRDDPAMAPPPHCLCAHHGAALDAAQFAQPGEAGTKTVAQRIVGVIVKALVIPEGVDIGRYILRTRAAPAKFRDMLI